MKIRIIKMFLWFFAGLGFTVIFLRIIHGPGSVTVLTDILPWGLWKGGGVVALVPIGAAGFTLAMLVYIFQINRFKPLVRGAVLLGLLCYSCVAFGLSMDIGIWWRIVFPVFHWQLNSVLFEISWCIMLYLIVLLAEFGHTVLEKFEWKRLLRVVEKLTIFLVIFGIGLSTLHQSSLGTLFLATPFRLHPLWHTDFLPLLFFVSSMALGCLTISFVTLFVYWLYDGDPPMKAISGLGRIAAYLVLSYLAIKFIEIVASGETTYLYQPKWDTVNFWVEVVLSGILPAAFLLREKYTNSRTAMFWISLCGIIGMTLNRINVAGLATLSLTRATYFPAWPEWTLTLGILSAAMLCYLFCVEYFDLFEGLKKENVRERMIPGMFDQSNWRENFFAGHRLGAVQFYSLTFIIASALSFGLLSDNAIFGISPERTPTSKPRLVEVEKISGNGNPGTKFVLQTEEEISGDRNNYTTLLMLDGNHDGRYVFFDHEAHQERNGEKKSCVLCHHMNKPYNKATGCYECHDDMYLASTIFDHGLHVEETGGNKHCTKCHKDLSQLKIRENTTPCLECHKNMVSPGSRIEATSPVMRTEAVGYMDAMHVLCIKCHEEEQKTLPEPNENLSRCTTCHQSQPDFPNEIWESRL